MAKTKTNPAIRDDGDLAAMLYWELPELANGELFELAEAVRPEMQLRVGERLSSLCGEDELAEFSELVDAGDEESCRTWLDKHVPDHANITITEIERLIAETVAAVEAADDARGAGVRTKRLRRIEPPNHSLLLRSLDFQGRSYSENGDAAFVEIDTAQGPSFTIRLSLTEGGLFCARSMYPDSIAQRLGPEILAFVHKWNVNTYFPKVYVVDSPEGEGRDVFAETAIPVAPGLHGQLLDHFVNTAISLTAKLFGELTAAAAGWQPPLF